MNNHTEVELIFERYKAVHISSRAQEVSNIIREYYNVDEYSANRLATLLEQKADQKVIDDIVKALTTEMGMTPEQIVQFGQQISQAKTPEDVQKIISKDPKVAQAFAQLQQQSSAEEQEEFFESFNGKKDFFISQSWNESIIQFLSENVDPYSRSWQRMLKEASNIFNSREVLLELTQLPHLATGSAPTGNTGQVDFISKLQEILNDPNVPEYVTRDIKNIINRVSTERTNVAAKPGIQQGATGKYTTGKGQTIDVTVSSVNTANDMVQVQPLRNGKPFGSAFAAQASKFNQNFVPSSSTAGPGSVSTPAGKTPPPLPTSPPGVSTGGKTPPPLPSSTTPGSQNIPAMPGASSSNQSPVKAGFLSKVKGALGKGWNWIKNNKWKSLLYAGGLAALAGIAMTAGPAAAGAAIIKAATSLPTAIATGAGALAGGVQGYRQAGAEGKSGLERAKATGMGALKKGAQALAGGVAGGLIGQGISQVADWIKGPQTADIGAPTPQRTIGSNNPVAPDYQTAAANQAETLGSKGVGRFNQIAGAADTSGNAIPGSEASAFNVGSTMDQAGANVMQILSQNGLDAQRFYDSYGQAATDLFGGDRSTAYQKLADMMVQLKQQGSTDIIQKLGQGKLGVGEFKQLFQSQINSSYEYKGDSQLLWEAYQDIAR